MNLLSTNEISKKLGCSRQHVLRLVKYQSLPCYRWGKALKFDEKEVEEWVENHRHVNEYDLSVVDEILRDITNNER